MDIIQRNFFRLLRSGALNSKEQIEPLSAYKWELVYQLALVHEVVPTAYLGLQRCKGQFFLNLTDKQWAEWKEAAAKPQPEEKEDDNLLRADHLTNPILNRRLQKILDSEGSNLESRQALLKIIHVVRHILNEGMPVKKLLELASFVSQQKDRIDFQALKSWTSDLKLNDMCQLEGEFLILLFGLDKEDLPFMDEKVDNNIERIAQELIDLSNTHSEDWYFSEDSNGIFVRNNNTKAMINHMKRSSRYFRYYPSEGITNFFASFVHSLSHIEE